MIRPVLIVKRTQSISGFDYIIISCSAMFDFAAATESRILCCNIHLLRLLSIGDCYLKNT